MATYKASRLADGNKLFPPEISLGSSGLTIKIPGIWGGKSKYIDYDSISCVETNTPLVGFTTLRFNVYGEEVVVHGFTKKEVNEIKDVINSGKFNDSSNHSFTDDDDDDDDDDNKLINGFKRTMIGNKSKSERDIETETIKQYISEIVFDIEDEKDIVEHLCYLENKLDEYLNKNSDIYEYAKMKYIQGVNILEINYSNSKMLAHFKYKGDVVVENIKFSKNDSEKNIMMKLDLLSDRIDKLNITYTSEKEECEKAINKYKEGLSLLESLFPNNDSKCKYSENIQTWSNKHEIIKEKEHKENLIIRIFVVALIIFLIICAILKGE